MKEPPQVDVDGAVKELDVPARNRHHRHDSRTVHHHIDSAKGIDGLFEQPLHIRRFSYVCLDSNGLSLGCLDCSHHFVGFFRLTCMFTTTAKPSRANLFATTLPIPPEAPVITAHLVVDT
jgi:hypothetical protein